MRGGSTMVAGVIGALLLMALLANAAEPADGQAAFEHRRRGRVGG
jgi:hypothetical protein